MRSSPAFRLLAALLLSLLLHLALVAQWPEWSLPQAPPDTLVVALRPLVRPPPAPVAMPPAAPPREADERPASVSPAPAPLPEASAEPPSAIEAAAEAAVAVPPAPAPEPVSEPVPAPEPAPAPEVRAESYAFPPEAAEPAPPVYVDMEFSVVRKGGMVAVERQTFEARDGRYRLSSAAEARGLLALALSDLNQVSEGEIDAQGLRPLHYRYQYGSDPEHARAADFDWAAGRLTLASGARRQQVALPPGAQDLLSFMYQFMYVPPLAQMQLDITNGKRLKSYAYQFEGEETLATNLGYLRCIKIAKSGRDEREKTELWLAADYHYLPVRHRDTDEDGVVTERILTRLSME